MNRTIDLHFDLPLALQASPPRPNRLASEFLPQFEAGAVGLIGAAIYVENQYLPDRALEIALAQVELLERELSASPSFILCRSFADILDAQAGAQIGILLTMEGAEPLGTDLDLLHRFYRRGLRSLSLTHARPNAAASGGIFAPCGSPTSGLTTFGRELLAGCEELGIVLDLAHINPAGFEEICARSTRPPIVSHTNARRFHDIERNISDEQIKMIGARGGVIGINAILVSAREEEATLGRYLDHVEHVASLIGIDHVAFGFDFCESLWPQIARSERSHSPGSLARPWFIPDLSNHAHAPNVSRELIRRGWSDEEVGQVSWGNWLRVLSQWL